MCVFLNTPPVEGSITSVQFQHHLFYLVLFETVIIIIQFIPHNQLIKNTFVNVKEQEFYKTTQESVVYLVRQVCVCVCMCVPVGSAAAEYIQ